MLGATLEGNRRVLIHPLPFPRSRKGGRQRQKAPGHRPTPSSYRNARRTVWRRLSHHQPQVLPAFCFSSHALSGAK
jgi:hypothetical protein